MKKIGSITVPENTKAILWDMDGVLIDSLALDLEVCNDLLKKSVPNAPILSREYIRSIFAKPVPAFWETIFESVSKEMGEEIPEAKRSAIINEYDHLRISRSLAVLPGVAETILAAKKANTRNAVVSSNREENIQKILVRAKILNQFDLIVGNNSGSEMPNKPEPDMYLYALKRLVLTSEDVVIIEDSLIGAEAGKRAGCYVIGVATGSNSVEELRTSSCVNQVYENLAATNK